MHRTCDKEMDGQRDTYIGLGRDVAGAAQPHQWIPDTNGAVRVLPQCVCTAHVHIYVYICTVHSYHVALLSSKLRADPEAREAVVSCSWRRRSCCNGELFMCVAEGAVLVSSYQQCSFCTQIYELLFAAAEAVLFEALKRTGRKRFHVNRTNK